MASILTLLNPQAKNFVPGISVRPPTHKLFWSHRNLSQGDTINVGTTQKVDTSPTSAQCIMATPRQKAMLANKEKEKKNDCELSYSAKLPPIHEEFSEDALLSCQISNSPSSQPGKLLPDNSEPTSNSGDNGSKSVGMNEENVSDDRMPQTAEERSTDANDGKMNNEGLEEEEETSDLDPLLSEFSSEQSQMQKTNSDEILTQILPNPEKNAKSLLQSASPPPAPVPAGLDSIQSMLLAMNNKLDTAMDDPQTGVKSQLRALQSMLGDPNTGLKIRTENNSKLLDQHKVVLCKHEQLLTSPSGVKKKTDEMYNTLYKKEEGLVFKSNKFESKIEVYDKLNKDFRVLESSITSNSGLSNTVKDLSTAINDNDEGLVATYLKVQEVHCNVTDPDSGLISKVQILQEDIKKISTAIETGETEVKIRAGPVQSIENKEILELKKKNKLLEERMAQVELSILTNSNLTTEQFASINKDLSVKAKRLVNVETKVSTLTNVADTQYRSMKRMKENIMMNAAKHMKDEILVGGIREVPSQSNLEAARQFFADKLQLPPAQYDILEAVRGKLSRTAVIEGRTVRIPPVMFLKVNPHFGALALKFAWRLGSLKSREGYGYYIHSNAPEGHRAV